MSTKTKKIEAKNYIIVGLIVLITIIAVFYARSLYIMSKEYYNDNSIMLEVVKEVKQEELQNYLIENPKFVLYVSSGQNKDIKNFEKTFKTTIVKEEIEDQILYLNSDNIDKKSLKQDLEKIAENNQKEKINSNSVISMYIIENEKITGVIENAEKLSTEQITSLFKKYGVIENA